jgi:TorA maturation chaperone TorD
LSIDSASDLASSRAKAYNFLASAYLQVLTKELIAEFLNHPPFSVKSEGMSKIEKFFTENRVKSPELLHDELNREYLRLFGGLPRDSGVPPPYESVWRGEGRLMGKTAMDVLKTYGDVGRGMTSRVSEPPDHIGIELTYVSYLCSKEAGARKSGDADAEIRYLRMQYDFLRQHILKWVPDFCEKIAKSDRTGFYGGIVTLTKEFVLADSEIILEELKSASNSLIENR